MSMVVYLRFGVALTLAFVMSGCVLSVEKRSLEMRTQLDEKGSQKNIEWAIDKLSKDITHEPNHHAGLIDSSVYVSNQTKMADVNPELYNGLVEALVNIVSKPPGPKDDEKWVEQGFPVGSTKDYLSSYAAYQLGNLKGPAISEQLLTILRETSSTGVRTTTLNGMLANLDLYTHNLESRAQAFAALADVSEYRGESGSKSYSDAFEAFEESIVTIEVLNTVLGTYDTYRLDDDALAYVLNVNERLWNYFLGGGDMVEFSLLQENARLLAVLALPQRKQFDGAIPTFSSPQKKAQQVLLAYAPGLYYFSMLENAKISDYSYGQLLATMSYMDRYDNFAATASDSLIVEGEEKRKFFNHRVLLNASIYTKSREKAENYVFTQLTRRTAENNSKYRNFIYSYLNTLFPARFAKYLVEDMNRPFKSASLDFQQSFYAMNLQYSEAVAATEKQALQTLVYAHLLARDLNYGTDDYTKYAKLIFPYLLKQDAERFVRSLNSNAKNISQVAVPVVTAEYFVKGLGEVNAATQSQYYALLGELLALQHEDVSKVVAGYLDGVEKSHIVALFERYVFAAKKKPNAFDYKVFSSLVNKHYSTLDSGLVQRIVTIYSTGTKKASEETAFKVAQLGLDFTRGRQGSSILKNNIKKRWPEINVAAIKEGL